MRVKITRLDGTVSLPAYGTNEAAGFDLAAAHDVTVAPGEVALVGTGLVIEVPTGHFLGIFARSSTPLKRGLMVANGVGIVDPDYAGPTDEVRIQVLNFTSSAVHVQRGDRLAQGIMLATPRASNGRKWSRFAPRRAAGSAAPAGDGHSTGRRRLSVASCTWTWTRSMRRSSSATTPGCAGGPWRSAASPTSAAW